MIVKNANYEVTAVRPDQYPVSNLPEIVFVGRSNVGKSSIINTLTNRKNLARVGATPGKTRQINFFNIDDVLYFVDLPGYGYANVSKAERKSWGDLADTYLFTRLQLRLIILLVDIRHKPSNEDKLMYKWIRESNFPHAVVATKEDKISRSQIKPRLNEIRKELEMKAGIETIPFSATARTGIEEVWNAIEKSIKAGENQE